MFLYANNTVKLFSITFSFEIIAQNSLFITVVYLNAVSFFFTLTVSVCYISIINNNTLHLSNFSMPYTISFSFVFQN